MESETFIRWALDGARTVEERYVVELLVEQGVSWWNSRHKIYRHESIDQTIERKRQRALNPAYEPRYSEESVRKAAEEFPRFTSWTFWGGMDERPVRDLAALRFLPNLEQLHVNGGEVTDLDVLAGLPKLRQLYFVSTKCEDYRPLARCRQLRDLQLTHWRTYFKNAIMWPDFTGLEQLDQLEYLLLEGNLLAFPRGVAWPRVRTAVLRCQPLAARNVRDLPQLPACEFLTLGGVEKLDGIAAFPRLRNLKIETDVRDFAPLAGLDRLTCFTCNAFAPADVSPLTRLPRLQCATFDTRFKYELQATPPRDFSPLGQSPGLRELHVENCPPVELEVAALNALFPPWDDVLLAAQPRPLPPKLRMVIAPHVKVPGGRGIQLDPGDDGLVDEGLRQCEGRWVGRFVEKSVSAKLGAADWGQAVGDGKYRRATVTIEAFAVVEKLPQIVEATRECLARLRHDYEATIMIDLKAPKLEPTPAQKQLLAQFEKEQDEADFERRQREQAEYLERLHDYELKKQLGEPIKPEEFAPAQQEPLPPPPWERDEEEDDSQNGDQSGFGGVKVKEKPDPPPDPWDDEHPLADKYRLMAHLTLDEIWFFSQHRDLAVYLMARQPDEEIPEDRPPET